MRCEVLLFANLAEAIGTDRLAIDLDEGSRVGDVLDKLAAEHDAIGQMRRVLAVAVNERYCPADAELNDGDVVALIGPVSGG